MTQRRMAEGEAISLQWSGDLGVRRVAELKAQLQGALSAATQVSITIAADAECDLTLMQLLCAAHRTAAGQNKSLQLCGEVPAQFSLILNLAGFSRHIGCIRDRAGDCLWTLVCRQPAKK